MSLFMLLPIFLANLGPDHPALEICEYVYRHGLNRSLILSALCYVCAGAIPANKRSAT